MVEFKGEFEFGSKVRDIITGFEGFVTDVAFYKYGCTQYLVQPIAKDGEYKDPDSIDEPQLELIGESTINKKQNKKDDDGMIIHKGKFGFGDKVKDNITEFEGIIIAINFNLFDCTQYLLQPMAKDGEQKESQYISEQRLGLIKKSKEPKPKPRNGGNRKHPKR